MIAHTSAKSWRRVARIALLAAFLVPATATAQLKPEVQTGSRIPVAPETVAAREAGIIKKGFAQCIYSNSPAAAASLLLHSDPVATDFAAARIKDMSEVFGMSECLGKQASPEQSALGFRFQRDMLRALLSEEAYLAGHRSVPTLQAGAVEAVERTYVSQGDGQLRAKALAAFSDCVVFTDVTDADALLRTMPASPAELLAARALAPALGACLAQGDKLSLALNNVRAFVADAMWNRFSRSSAPALAAKRKS